MDFIRTHLCCCFVAAQDHDREDQNRRFAGEHEIPNETTLLIPQEEGEGGPFVGYGSYQDQERLERRLGGIVRSKERFVWSFCRSGLVRTD